MSSILTRLRHFCMPGTDINNLLRSVPSMEEMLNMNGARMFSDILGRETVKSILTETGEAVKSEMREGAEFDENPADIIMRRAEITLRKRSSGTLKRVINATGIVIHTNLGRAPLADEALRAVNETAGAYGTLEYDTENGGRGDRNAHVEWLVCRLTGAEAALVVNNNAAAVLLALSTLASGREVIVSCGELVEIGGSFRIPDILSFSGAKMTAVGCTNATRIDDYAAAVTENTAVLLKVHQSNYKIDGFVTSTSCEELAELAFSRNLSLIEDLGSGLLTDLDLPFANGERSVYDRVKAARRAPFHAVTFSGDKLLGGPQIGVIAGSKSLVDAMRKHQLLRALRVDKMTLAAFEATLRLYLAGKKDRIPVITMIEAGKNDLLKRARSLCRSLKAASSANDNFNISVAETSDAVGGGAYPADTLPGFGVAIRFSSGAEKLAGLFRTAGVPVITRIRDDGVVLHVRTLLPNEERFIIEAFKEIIKFRHDP